MLFFKRSHSHCNINNKACRDKPWKKFVRTMEKDIRIYQRIKKSRINGEIYHAHG